MFKVNNKNIKSSGIFTDVSENLFTHRDIKCPATIYLLKFNNRNTGKRCEIRSKLTIETPDHISKIDFSNFFFRNAITQDNVDCLQNFTTLSNVNYKFIKT